jgi:hypothetical protein
MILFIGRPSKSRKRKRAVLFAFWGRGANRHELPRALALAAPVFREDPWFEVGDLQSRPYGQTNRRCRKMSHPGGMVLAGKRTCHET